MMHRIRKAMSPDDKAVESDETYVSGRSKNAKKGEPIPKKHPVMALIERAAPMERCTKQ